jgi:4-amino-4-deoxy-L-arabinose transferase-like glycosyltransferase
LSTLPQSEADSAASIAARTFLLPRAVPSAATLELAAVSAITVVALAVRLPELATVPRFTDEVLEVAIGSQIARGQALPLVNVNPYLGSLFNYLVALTLLVLGPQLEAARVVAMLCGSLTVVPTYLLGRSIGGPLVGLLSALLLATSAIHIAVNSHIAYANSITPLFVTTGLWLLHRAVTGGSGPMLVASGVAFGLALQTHATMLAIMPGVALYILWQGRSLIGRWLIMAGAGAVLVLANLLVFNVMSGFSGVARAGQKSSIGLQGAALTLDAWASRLLVLLGEFAQGLAGLLTEAGGPPPEVWLYPLAGLYAALALFGLVLLSRRGEWLPCLVLVSGLLAMSLLTAKFRPMVVNGRYYAPLIPLGYVLVALALATLYQYAGRMISRPWMTDAAALAVGTALVAAQVLLLHRYYERAHGEARTNLIVLATLEAVAQDGRPDDPVYLDRKLKETPPLNVGRHLEVLSVGFMVAGQRFDAFDPAGTALPRAARGTGHRLILHPDSLLIAERRYRLQPLPGEPGTDAPVRAFLAYPRGSSQAAGRR